MRKVLHYLKKSWLSILIIIAFLAIEAICDLSLPTYTSNIVNVGVQQGGIEEVVPRAIRKSAMEELLLFVPSEEEQKILSSYRLVKKNSSSEDAKKYPALKEEDIYLLKEDDTEMLEENMTFPLLASMMLHTESEQSKQIEARIKEQLPPTMQEMDLKLILGSMKDEQVEEFVSKIEEQLNDYPDSILDQMALAAVKEEYKALGMDMERIQTNYIVLTGLKMLGIALLAMVSAIFIGFLGSKTAAKLAKNLRSAMFQKVTSFSTSEFKQYGVSSLITRSTNDIQQIQMLIVFTLRIIFYAPIIAIGGLIKVLNTNTSMAWIIAVAIGAVLTLMIFAFFLVMPKFQKLQKLIDRLNQVTREILTGIPVIRAFSNQKYEEKRFDKANTDLKKTTLFVNRSMSLLMPSLMFVMNSICVLIVWKGAHGINDGLMQVGDMLAFIQYTMQIVMSFLMVSMFSIMMPRAAVSIRRVGEVLSTENSIVDPVHPKSYSKRIQGTVEFRHVTFRYPDSDEDVLTDINFVAKPGQTTAFIGSTGSGKSTLINLVPRLFDVTEGEVLVDGVNVKEVPLKELHKKIGFVPQKGVLFSGTIRSNIAYGNPDASEEEVKRAARIAQAEEFILEKEEQYDSPISQGGTNVSGGQKQRLSIARAIATNPEIYVFDDSFSALDFKTDATLRQALKKETQGSTVLIVAQRVSTILSADQIVVLDEGKVVGIGTHQELLKHCDVYREIAESQLTKEEIEHA